MTILNDRVCATGVLENGFVYKRLIFVQLYSVIRFLNEQGYDKTDILNICRGRLLELDEVRVYGGEDNLEESLNIAYETALKSPYEGDSFVNISKSEIEEIKKLPYMKHQKLVFTILALTRFQQQKGKSDKDFIFTPVKDIFQLAGCKILYSKERYDMIRALIDEGAIQTFVTSKGTDVCFRALMSKPPVTEEDIGGQVNNYQPFGDQWIKISGQDVFTCKRCGKQFPRTQLNIEYCSNCFTEHRKEYLSEKAREYRARNKENKQAQ